MKVLMIGGTGLLGSQTARELISRGHSVHSIALPPLPEGALLPPEMTLTLKNSNDMTDEELKSLFKGVDGFIFAAGVDERIEGPSPIYDFFKKYNITPLERFLRLAKESGVKHAVIAGSYFSYFAKQWPEMELGRWHPYIRSRLDQETMAFSFADEHFDVSVLELPYIFGAQKGRKPVWVFLVEMLRGMKGAVLYPRGGTTMVTVRQVGEAFAGALERGHGANAYPIGWFNMTWKEMISVMHRYMGTPKKKIITIPTWLFAASAKQIEAKQRSAGTEGGTVDGEVRRPANEESLHRPRGGLCAAGRDGRRHRGRHRRIGYAEHGGYRAKGEGHRHEGRVSHGYTSGRDAKITSAFFFFGSAFLRVEEGFNEQRRGIEPRQAHQFRRGTDSVFVK